MVIHWGWYYLSTVLDDYSRYILSWKLCTGMSVDDVKGTIDLAIVASGVDHAYVRHRPRLLSDNGPCCFELANDLETLHSIGVLRISPDRDGYGCHIRPGDPKATSQDLGTGMLPPFSGAMRFVVDSFAGCDASEIKLKATIHYVYQLFRSSAPSATSLSQQFKIEVVEAVQQLKPKFTSVQVDGAFEEISNLGLL